VGFGLEDRNDKIIFEYADIKGEPLAVPAKNINPYLVDFADLLLERRSKPICNVQPLVEGITPLDNGILAFTNEERLAFIQKEPRAEKWFRRWLTGNDLINGQSNYCLWLSEATATELRSMPHVMEKIAQVKQFRENSKSSQKFAVTPRLFRETTIPDKYILIPKTSSERRRIFPLGFVENAVATNSALYMNGGGLYEFGIICSAMHNAWICATCGRLESRFRYSKDIVYNNYPWPETPTDKQKEAIEKAAQKVLDVRAEFPNSSLADLYDPLTMPPALVKAHNELDKAVDLAYRPQPFTSDANRMEFLFELYEKYTAGLFAVEKKGKKK
jgi:hypothetical protein